MGGHTNLRSNLVERLRTLYGEREEVHATIVEIRDRWMLIHGLEAKLKELDAVIEHVQGVIRFDYPEIELYTITPRKRGTQRSPVAKGEIGFTALAILREATESMTSREIAREVLNHFGTTNPDRLTLDRLTNSVNAYLAKYKGDVVEADSRYSRKWQVIR